MKTSTIRRLTRVALVAIGLVVTLGARADALEIVVQNDPVLAGTGSDLSARFTNVATVDGRQIDLFAEIVSQSQSGVTHTFYRIGDDFGFLLNPSELEETRVATVRYSFLDGATSYPATLADFSLTIADLDGYELRTDSVASSDSVGYILNDPTNVVATASGSEVSFTGSAQQLGFAPQPEAAVQLRFATRSSYSVTYTSENSITLPADFTHDGNGDFVFGQPSYTASPKRLYYTFSYTNQEADPVWMNFYDQLPEGLFWDPYYVPETVGGLGEIVVNYSNSHRDASIGRHVMPVGFSSFKLRTLPTQMTGKIDNQATMKFARRVIAKTDLVLEPVLSDSLTGVVLDSNATTPVEDATRITEKTVFSSVTIVDYTPTSSP